MLKTNGNWTISLSIFGCLNLIFACLYLCLVILALKLKFIMFLFLAI